MYLGPQSKSAGVHCRAYKTIQSNYTNLSQSLQVLISPKYGDYTKYNLPMELISQTICSKPTNTINCQPVPSQSITSARKLIKLRVCYIMYSTKNISIHSQDLQNLNNADLFFPRTQLQCLNYVDLGASQCRDQEPPYVLHVIKAGGASNLHQSSM